MKTERTARAKWLLAALSVLACWPILVTKTIAVPPPVITQQPSNQTVALGGNATFVVVATSGTTLTYQWYFQAAMISGATNDTFTRTNAQFTNAGAYYVAVQNAGGTVNSSNAILWVTNAPVLSGANNLNPIYQDDVNNGGTLASNLITGKITDPDTNALKGIAVTAVVNTDGAWQYSTNRGTNWLAFGAPSETAARLLAANTNTFVRFVPNTNWNGTVTNGLTFRAWDQTSGTAGGTANVTTNGGITAFSSNSASSSITVNPLFATLYVDTTSDVVDGTTSSISALIANKGADGKISLREAILAANSTSNGPGGPDRIYFDITNALVSGAHTINLTNALPSITNAVIIDGTTDGYFLNLPVIELDGAGAGAGVNGLTISSNGSTLRGLAFDRFSSNGLVLAGNSNTVELSCFGTGVNGMSALGNGGAGILITGRSNTVGGAYGVGVGALSQYNVIGGNTNAGILISGTNAVSNVVIGNYIGVSTDGTTALANAHGVRIDTGANHNRIGGTGTGEPNQIAANVGDGISVISTNSTDNAFLANVIRANGGLGIDLNDDAVTLNDSGDGDTGPNRRQNFPVISSASFNSTSLTVSGSLNSTVASAFRLEFFRLSAATADPSGYGEVESFVGTVNVTTDGSGNASFNTTFPGVLLNGGDKVTATATRDFGGGAFGDSSEFALNVTATNIGTPGFNISALSPLAQGGEVRANTTTNADQYWYDWSVRAIAVAPDGSFVGTWIDTGGADGNKKGIFGQRFDASGNKVGGEFIVNTTRTGDQGNLALAMDSAGNFLVLWDGPGDGSGTGVFAQRFLADGTRVGGEFLINTTTSGTQQYPEAAFATNGSFVVAWKGPNPYGTGTGTIAQRFDANANKVGGEILVNNFTGKDQIIDSMDVRADGAFIVTWGDSGDVYARIFDASGSALSAVLLLNSNLSGAQQYSVARFDAAGNFIAIWESAGQDGSGDGVFGRRFAPDGTPMTGEFALTTLTAGDQYGPVLAMDQFGNFVAAWTDANAADGSADSVWLQRFTTNGTRVGTAQRANVTTSGFQGFPVIAMNRLGNVVLGWEGNGTGDSYGAFFRRYQVNPVVTEGSNTTFTISLNTAPTAPVTLNLSPSDAGEISLSPSALTFNPTNWSVAQTVTITGISDHVVDGDQNVTIITAPATSTDSAYNGLNPDDIPVLVLDSGTTNNPPVANSQSVAASFGTPQSIVLTGSDADSDPLTFAITASPTNGAISGFNTNTGALTYTPNNGFSGADAFSFRVNDGIANSSAATVSITVAPGSDVATTVSGPSAVFTLDNFTYIIAVTNLGPTTATNVMVTNALPAGVSYISASGGGTYGGGKVTWPALVSLVQGASTTFAVTVMAPAGSTLTNFAYSMAASGDPNPTNNNGTSAAGKVVTIAYVPVPPSATRLPAGGGLQLQFFTLPNTTEQIQASTNLVNWITLATTNSPSGFVGFVDTNASAYQQRFYRTVQIP